MDTGHRQRPDLPTDRLILFVVKTTATSGNNVVKPLMLIESLEIPHHIDVVNCQVDQWFAEINPLKLVPAIQDKTDSAGLRATVFESSACMRYVAENYDIEGRFSGRTRSEKAQVSSWLAMHNAGLGAQAKWWLTLSNSQEPEIEGALRKIKAAIKNQYRILNDRLANAGQRFVALPDRPTIADFATLPFANDKVAAVADIDFSEYPMLKSWSGIMFALPGVTRAYERMKTFGHVTTCNCSKMQ
ncbi:hypothetical protein K504DRAFT_465024 [Pleomassaria siparia CBS 279.74]|uniref:glutathione transferase n=1 Tax=Pleomassaria siparia CBS 279.74 TaxID=1314801 RepID=A0A6G1KEK3_9PLEO|nr:hypothetical protein K504DRAFT_465024 [Pleomassaria siparia CBS 279.74]